MFKNLAELDASIQAKLDSDIEFQSTLEGLSEEEKSQKVSERKQQELDREFSSLTEKSAKNEELATNYKTRAEKAEAEAKKKESVKTDEGLSNKDVIYLAKADIHQEDLDEVLDWAKFKKITVQEAHKQLKSVLDLKKEERASKEVMHAKGSGRGASKVTDEQIIEEVEKGNIPEDESSIQKLAEARINARIKALK